MLRHVLRNSFFVLFIVTNGFAAAPSNPLGVTAEEIEERFTNLQQQLQGGFENLSTLRNDLTQAQTPQAIFDVLFQLEPLREIEGIGTIQAEINEVLADLGQATGQVGHMRTMLEGIRGMIDEERHPYSQVLVNTVDEALEALQTSFDFIDNFSNRIDSYVRSMGAEEVCNQLRGFLNSIDEAVDVAIGITRVLSEVPGLQAYTGPILTGLTFVKGIVTIGKELLDNTPESIHMVADIAKVGLGCMKQVMSSIVDWSVKVYTDEAIDTVESIIGPVMETLPEIFNMGADVVTSGARAAADAASTAVTQLRTNCCVQ